MRLSRSDREDLRLYLAQCIEALRWLKNRQLSLTGYAVAVEFALLSSPVRDGVDRAFGPGSTAIVAILTLILYSIAYLLNWKSTRQTRLREEKILRELSPKLMQVIKKTNTDRKYGNEDWKPSVDIFSTVTHFFPVVGLCLLNTKEFICALVCL